MIKIILTTFSFVLLTTLFVKIGLKFRRSIEITGLLLLIFFGVKSLPGFQKFENTWSSLSSSQKTEVVSELKEVGKDFGEMVVSETTEGVLSDTTTVLHRVKKNTNKFFDDLTEGMKNDLNLK